MTPFSCMEMLAWTSVGSCLGSFSTDASLSQLSTQSASDYETGLIGSIDSYEWGLVDGSKNAQHSPSQAYLALAL